MIEFPALTVGPDITISASSYVAYRQCPDRALARFRGEYGPESVPAFRGNLAHRIFARHLRDGPIDEDGFALACREEIGSSNLNYKMGELGLTPTVLRGVIEEVGALYERFRRLPGEGFQGAEVALKVDIGVGVHLAGVIDAVFHDDDRARLVDWKTGTLGEAQDQLDFYALVWHLQFGSIPQVAEAVSVQTGERMELRFSTADLLRVAHDISDMVNTLRAALMADRSLTRTGGPWCRFCPILDGCQEGGAAVAVQKSSVAGIRTGPRGLQETV